MSGAERYRTVEDEFRSLDEYGLSVQRRGCERSPEESAYLARVTQIAISRTACFGPCPVYTLRLFRDGRVEYFGESHVRRLGLHTGNLEPYVFDGVALLARDIGFFSLADSYEIGVTDHPTTYTLIALTDERKIVMNYVGGPPRLEVLESAIERTIGKVVWSDRSRSEDAVPSDSVGEE